MYYLVIEYDNGALGFYCSDDLYILVSITEEYSEKNHWDMTNRVKDGLVFGFKVDEFKFKGLK